MLWDTPPTSIAMVLTTPCIVSLRLVTQLSIITETGTCMSVCVSNRRLPRQLALSGAGGLFGACPGRRVELLCRPLIGQELVLVPYPLDQTRNARVERRRVYPDPEELIPQCSKATRGDLNHGQDAI